MTYRLLLTAVFTSATSPWTIDLPGPGGSTQAVGVVGARLLSIHRSTGEGDLVHFP